MTEINIILTILESLQKENANNVFINSLHHQFCNRGGLSKKQLEGLHAKAIQSNVISQAKIATLEAIIKKKPTRYKSEIIKNISEEKIDNSIELSLQQILAKYPNHKMALFLHSKLVHHDPFTEGEKNEVKRLAKVLLTN